jgi:hypothetical protein
MRANTASKKRRANRPTSSRGENVGSSRRALLSSSNASRARRMVRNSSAQSSSRSSTRYQSAGMRRASSQLTASELLPAPAIPTIQVTACAFRIASRRANRRRRGKMSVKRGRLTLAS